MNYENNKSVIRTHLQQMWHEGDMTIAEDICAENLAYHDPASTSVISLESYITYINNVRQAFPDLKYLVYDMIGDDNKILVRWRFEGSHKGEIRGINATGRRVSFTGMSLYTVEGGKITEAWVNWDTYGYLQQLGVLPMRQRMAGETTMEAEG